MVIHTSSSTYSIHFLIHPGSSKISSLPGIYWAVSESYFLRYWAPQDPWVWCHAWQLRICDYSEGSGTWVGELEPVQKVTQFEEMLLADFCSGWDEWDWVEWAMEVLWISVLARMYIHYPQISTHTVVEFGYHSLLRNSSHVMLAMNRHSTVWCK